MSPVSSLLSYITSPQHCFCQSFYVSFLTSSVSCLASPVLYLLSQCLISPFSRLLSLSEVSCLTTCLLTHISRVMSSISRLLSHVSRRTPPVCLTSPVSLMSYASCLSHISCRSHIFCRSHFYFLSYVSCLFHVSCLSHFYCTGMSHVSCLVSRLTSFLRLLSLSCLLSVSRQVFHLHHSPLKEGWR